MSRGKWAQRVDDNQSLIIDQLRNMGVSVAPRHDDLFVGFRGKNYWFEVKNPAVCFNADGITYKKGAIKESQMKLRRTWRGHYSVVTHIEQILEQIGYSTNEENIL